MGRSSGWAVVLSCWLGSLALAQNDGLRAVNVERFGISTRVPQAWPLTAWNRDDQAFRLRLPQAAGSREGYVSCRLRVAPESLTAYRDRYDADEEQQTLEIVAGRAPNVRRILLDNQIVPVDASRYGAKLAELFGQWLVTTWTCQAENGQTWLEVSVKGIAHGALYSFTLASDEAHFDAYRADFDDMLAASRITPPETGLVPLEGGFWMQPEFRFAMWLPEGWRPAFGASQRVLFFAAGAAHEDFSDTVTLAATPPRPIEFDELMRELPEQIVQQDPEAKVLVCQVIRQGERAALETIFQTKRGNIGVTILERRFTTPLRSYEIRIACENEAFKRQVDALRRMLESFIELSDAARPAET